jgi:hypothetical protein
VPTLWGLPLTDAEVAVGQNGGAVMLFTQSMLPTGHVRQPPGTPSVFSVFSAVGGVSGVPAPDELSSVDGELALDRCLVSRQRPSNVV